MNAFLSLLLGIVSLSGQWQFRCTSPEGEWMNGTVPGAVQTDLMASGIIDDPFYGDNEKRVQWIGEKNWEYRRCFEVSAEDLAQTHLELVFEGIDTYATIFVNGHKVLRADNMFRTWRVDVKDFLHEGRNEIRVAFDSVFKIDIPKYLAAPYKLQAWPNNDQSDLWISLYARKAGYNYGWDWGPRLVTSGIWKPVYLDCWSDIRLKPSQVVTNSISSNKALMQAFVEIESDHTTEAMVEIKSEGKTLYKAVRNIAEGENRLECPFIVRKPELWWTKALGGQKIYDFDIKVTISGKTVERTESTGIRTVEVVRERDTQGQSFYVRLNGTPVFMKGADWVPQDNFPARVSKERYALAIDDAVRANMNMLRVWGGGLYESDDFYEACDRAGILVWQDMAFACGMFPSDDAYLESVAAEVHDNVSRLRNHPSLALWCGNNENEISYFEWGWNRTITADQRREYESSLHKLFYEIIPEAICFADATRYYHPGSPSTGFNGIPYNQGDAHYWGVWKGAWVEEYLKPENIARFMSEYGFQSYPDIKTIDSFASHDQQYVGSNVMLAHQKAHDDNTRDPNFGDNMMKKYMEHYYRIPDNFSEYVYLGQFQQAEAVKAAMEAHRRAKPYCMGTLFWQLNDCWPVASWSSVDYYGRWKPLQFYARRAYSDVLVSPYLNELGKAICIRVVSDLMKETNAELDIKVVDFNGIVRLSKILPINIAADSSVDVMEIPLSDVPEGNFVEIRLYVKGRLLSENQFFPEFPNRYSYMPASPSITAEDATEGVTLHISSKTLIRGLMLTTNCDEDVFEDNCLTIVPGYEYIVNVRTKTNADAFIAKLSYQSLNDIMK